MIQFLTGGISLLGLIVGAIVGAGGWAFYSTNIMKKK